MKRIAIFLDGTWATLEDNTNVWRLKCLCDPRARDQLVYYSKGIGTQSGDAVRGGVEGYGIDQEIIHAYAWLTECFEPGDELFIFGFSRGAYTARSLSGLVAKCGILKPGATLSGHGSCRPRRSAEARGRLRWASARAVAATRLV